MSGNRFGMSLATLGVLQGEFGERLLSACRRRRKIANCVSSGVTDPSHLAYQDGVVETLESVLGMLTKFMEEAERQQPTRRGGDGV